MRKILAPATWPGWVVLGYKAVDLWGNGEFFAAKMDDVLNFFASPLVLILALFWITITANGWHSRFIGEIRNAIGLSEQTSPEPPRSVDELESMVDILKQEFFNNRAQLEQRDEEIRRLLVIKQTFFNSKLILLRGLLTYALDLRQRVEAQPDLGQATWEHIEAEYMKWRSLVLSISRLSMDNGDEEPSSASERIMSPLIMPMYTKTTVRERILTRLQSDIRQLDEGLKR